MIDVKKVFIALSGAPADLVHSLSVCGEIIKPHHKVFPDGEQYLRFDIEPQNNIDTVIIQSFFPEQDRKIIEFALALEALQGLNQKADTAIIPYLSYARQDKRFLRGEPVSAAAIFIPILKYYGVKSLVSVDVHSNSIIKLFKEAGINLHNIIPHDYLARKASVSFDVVVSPDLGAYERGATLVRNLGGDLIVIEKYRDRLTGEISMKKISADVGGKRVVIVDDIVSTGGTLAKAVEILYSAGASSVEAIVTHALMVGKASEVLEASGLKRLYAANTVTPQVSPPWLVRIDVGELICRALAEISSSSV